MKSKLQLLRLQYQINKYPPLAGTFFSPFFDECTSIREFVNTIIFGFYNKHITGRVYSNTDRRVSICLIIYKVNILLLLTVPVSITIPTNVNAKNIKILDLESFSVFRQFRLIIQVLRF
jgi:hypothetical protein